MSKKRSKELIKKSLQRAKSAMGKGASINMGGVLNEQTPHEPCPELPTEVGSAMNNEYKDKLKQKPAKK